MRLLDYIPIKLTLFLIFGIIIGVKLNINSLASFFWCSVCICLLGILFSGSLFQKTNLYGYIAALLTIGTGVFSVAIHRPECNRNHYMHLKPEKEALWRIKIREKLKSSAYSQGYIAEVKGRNKLDVKGKVVLRIISNSGHESLFIDDEIQFYKALRLIDPPQNPHQFDYQKYMSNLGVSYQVSINEKQYVKSKDPEMTIYGFTANLRNVIILNLQEAGFKGEELAIIQALLLGQRSHISKATYEDYKNAGAVHILALSGLHIGILLLFLQYLFKPLEFIPKGKTIKLGCIVTLMWFFAFLAGLSASVVRAVTMFTFVAYAWYLNRPSNSFNVLALSVFFILLINNPMLLFQVGFQMSYMAVLAIVWIYPKLLRYWNPGNMFLKKLWQLLAVSLAAQLGVLPISLYYFHQFPGLFFVSNLLIVPFLGFILGTGIVIIITALVGVLPKILVTIYSTIIKIMNELINWIAMQEAFVLKDIPFDGVQLFLSYFLIVALVLTLEKINFKNFAFLLCGILTLQGWAIVLHHQLKHKERIILLHQTANTALLHHKGAYLDVYALDHLKLKSLLTNYTVAQRISKTSNQPIKNTYTLDRTKILIIDSLSILPPNFNPDILILTQSPKLNLERYLSTANPKLVIADGSNYYSYIARWKATCAQRKLPFHATAEKGAYYFISIH